MGQMRCTLQCNIHYHFKTLAFLYPAVGNLSDTNPSKKIGSSPKNIISVLALPEVSCTVKEFLFVYDHEGYVHLVATRHSTAGGWILPSISG